VSGLLRVIAVPLFVLLAGALFQAIGSAIDRRRYPPPGRLVPVKGARLHAYSQGEGEPTIRQQANWLRRILTNGEYRLAGRDVVPRRVVWGDLHPKLLHYFFVGPSGGQE